MFRQIEAVLTLSGMIIGVGMFGIPFAFARAGFWVGAAELIAISGVALLLHLLYSELVLHTPGNHRTPGYVSYHLGKKIGSFAAVVSFFGITGTLLAYILIGATFADNVAQSFWSGSSPFWWALIIAAGGSLITVFPLRKEALVNGLLTVLLIGFLVFLIARILPEANFSRFGEFHLSEIFFPYGVLIFALSGTVAIPDVAALLDRDRKKIRRAIVWGSLIPAALYFFFALAVVGVSNGALSPDAIEGLRGKVGEQIIVLGSAIGFLAVFTSYVILHSNTQALIVYDIKVPKPYAWLAASVVPFILYLAGLNSFILIISIVGAVAGGIETALVISAFRKIRQKEGFAASRFFYLWRFVLFVMIAAGILYEAKKFF